MNPREVVSARNLAALSFFNPIANTQIVSVEKENDFVSYEITEARNRYNRPVRMLESQRDIITRILNPFRLKSIRVAFSSERKAGFSISTQAFPCARIVNLPTGVGKTLITTLGAYSAAERFRHSFPEALHQFLQSFHFPTVRGSISTCLESRESLLLPNVIFVFSPKHLVGQWRDTLFHNRPSNAYVFPESSSLNLSASSFNVDEILSRPEHLFVYVLHPGNYKKMLLQDEKQIVVGVAIFDEADSEHFPCKESHVKIPVSMYTLMVTATPNNISNFPSSRETTTNLIGHYFSHPFFPGGLDRFWINCKNRHVRNFLSEIIAMQIVMPHPDFQSGIVDEICAHIPNLHSYTIRTRTGFARSVFGSTSNDLENPRAALEKIERELEIRIYGQTIEAMREQIREHLSALSALATPNAYARSRMDVLQGTLRRVESLDESCGICLDEFHGALRLTSCCGFLICPSCHERITICAKCRNPNVKYFDLVSDERPAPKSKKGAAAATVVSQTASRVAPMKNTEGFEEWLASFSFSNVDQLTALNTITERAMEFGITHIIVAGANVDSWNGLGVNADRFFDYSIVRPAGHTAEQTKKTAKRLDAAYRKYCSGEEPSVLILDSRRNDSVELTGIDAGVTDLIIQIGVEAGGSAYTQLAGRAMRFGRAQTNPIRIIFH